MVRGSALCPLHFHAAASTRNHQELLELFDLRFLLELLDLRFFFLLFLFLLRGVSAVLAAAEALSG